MVHLISYDLIGYRPPHHYTQVEQGIRDISNIYMHVQKSEWLVETELSEKAVAERLWPLMYSNDKLLVTRVYKTWAAFNLTQEQLAWFNGRNFGSLIEAIMAVMPGPFSTIAKLGR